MIYHGLIGQTTSNGLLYFDGISLNSCQVFGYYEDLDKNYKIGGGIGESGRVIATPRL